MKIKAVEIDNSEVRIYVDDGENYICITDKTLKQIKKTFTDAFMSGEIKSSYEGHSFHSIECSEHLGTKLLNSITFNL